MGHVKVRSYGLDGRRCRIACEKIVDKLKFAVTDFNDVSRAISGAVVAAVLVHISSHGFYIRSKFIALSIFITS